MDIGLNVSCHFSKGNPTPPRHWPLRPANSSKIVRPTKIEMKICPYVYMSPHESLQRTCNRNWAVDRFGRLASRSGLCACVELALGVDGIYDMTLHPVWTDSEWENFSLPAIKYFNFTKISAVVIREYFHWYSVCILQSHGCSVYNFWRWECTKILSSC